MAADELYDGPFCVLSLVDNHSFKRLVYDVLDHAATKDDILRFFSHFKGLLLRRGHVVRGITTDGSALYPEAISQVFGAIPHQICEFHILKDVNHAVLRALAKLRKEIAASIPKAPSGTPRTAAQRRAARKAKRLRLRVTELFDNRHLFVRRDLTDAQRKTLARLTRSDPRLRPLREIVEEVYRLFDRRCRLDTALARLAVLRRRVRRFRWIGRVLQKLFSPTVEKALTFLDDSLLPSTSNAVERGNRRHRKMQKSVYRVRTRTSLVARIALDLLRERGLASRASALETIRDSREGGRPRRSPPPRRQGGRPRTMAAAA